LDMFVRPYTYTTQPTETFQTGSEAAISVPVISRHLF
jgi:hypothetical protein